MSSAALSLYYTLCFMIGLSSSLDVRTVVDANMKAKTITHGYMVCPRYQFRNNMMPRGSTLKTFSYLVSFGPNTTGRYAIDVKCSGVMMTPKYIFTAAHCFYKPDGGKKDLKSLVAVTGSAYIHGFSYNRQYRGFQEAWIHSKYKPMSFVNDLAIGEMDRDFITTLFSSPIRSYASKTPNKDVGDYYWNNCISAGFWGPWGTLRVNFDCLRLRHLSSCNYTSGVKGAMCVGFGAPAFREQGAPLVCRAQGHDVVTGIMLSSVFDRHRGRQWPAFYLKLKDYWNDNTVTLASAPE